MTEGIDILPGMITVPRLLTVRQFCELAQVSESTVRHNLPAYRHLTVKYPARKIRFDAAKVHRGIQNGDLTKI